MSAIPKTSPVMPLPYSSLISSSSICSTTCLSPSSLSSNVSSYIYSSDYTTDDDLAVDSDLSPLYLSHLKPSFPFSYSAAKIPSSSARPSAVARLVPPTTVASGRIPPAKGATSLASPTDSFSPAVLPSPTNFASPTFSKSTCAIPTSTLPNNFSLPPFFPSSLSHLPPPSCQSPLSFCRRGLSEQLPCSPSAYRRPVFSFLGSLSPCTTSGAKLSSCLFSSAYSPPSFPDSPSFPTPPIPAVTPASPSPTPILRSSISRLPAAHPLRSTSSIGQSKPKAAASHLSPPPNPKSSPPNTSTSSSGPILPPLPPPTLYSFAGVTQSIAVVSAHSLPSSPLSRPLLAAPSPSSAAVPAPPFTSTKSSEISGVGSALVDAVRSLIVSGLHAALYAFLAVIFFCVNVFVYVGAPALVGLAVYAEYQHLYGGRGSGFKRGAWGAACGGEGVGPATVEAPKSLLWGIAGSKGDWRSDGIQEPPLFPREEDETLPSVKNAQEEGDIDAGECGRQMREDGGDAVAAYELLNRENVRQEERAIASRSSSLIRDLTLELTGQSRLHLFSSQGAGKPSNIPVSKTAAAASLSPPSPLPSSPSTSPHAKTTTSNTEFNGKGNFDCELQSPFDVVEGCLEEATGSRSGRTSGSAENFGQGSGWSNGWREFGCLWVIAVAGCAGVAFRRLMVLAA